MDEPTVSSLFSGIGGLDLGLHRAGWRHVFFCESDGYRRDVLGARFPGVPVYEDVRGMGSGLWDAADGSSDGDTRYRRNGLRPPALICGGFPCQDISVAGRRAGLAGERSGLFHEFARIADALRPRWLLVENVPGLLSSNGGRDFGVVLGTLADLGYGLAYRVLDSRFFGVPQRRRRVFIVGAVADGDPRAAAESAGEVLAVGSRCLGHPATRGETREDVAVASLSGLGTGGPDDNDGQGGRLVANGLVRRYGKGTDSDAIDTLIAGPLGGGNHGTGRRTEDDPNLVAYALRKDPDGTGQGHNTNYVPEGASVRRLMPVECERLQALPDGWTDLGGTPDSRRYAALGDAVTASVAEWIGARMLAQHLGAQS